MQFYMRKSHHPPRNSVRPCVVLSSLSWFDFNDSDFDAYETLFGMYFYAPNAAPIKIGNVKILKKDKRLTKDYMDEEFINLSDDFCSLGQELSYYKKLSKLQLGYGKEILHALKDIATNEKVERDFYSEKGFKYSLLRFSEAEKAFKQANQYFGKKKINNNFKFTFQSQLDYATAPHKINFDFNQDKDLPFRINVLIGKNGTGKTQILSRLANVVSGYKQEQGEFEPSRPLFSKVIAISYSAFDNFEKPHQDNSLKRDPLDSLYAVENNRTLFSYVYCGLQGNKGVYTVEQLKENLRSSYKIIEGKNRKQQWKKILSEIIENEHINVIEEIEKGNFDVSISSGQGIILSTLTDVIAHIEEDSILLFDEPEIHLHPNAISNLLRMFYVLLNEFKSYAIISTHSPIIIQETPSKYVHVFKRFNNTPSVIKLELECFGESLNNIVKETFGVKNSESNYKYWLKKMSEKMSYEEVLNKFDNNLSFNAMTFLNILYKSKGDTRLDD